MPISVADPLAILVIAFYIPESGYGKIPSLNLVMSMQVKVA